jgi:hypothetical protein
MSIYNSHTGDYSSRLAKGVAKEKQVERDLQIKHPSASVARTPATGDGGKDIVVDRGDQSVFYEIKNWERPMCVHDIREYISLHDNVDASLKIYNEGGFSTTAETVANEADVELISGSEYISPSCKHLLRWCGQRLRSGVYTGVRRAMSTSSQYGRQLAMAVKNIFKQGAKPLGKWLYRLAKKYYHKLSFKQLGSVLLVVGPIWLYYKRRKGEYEHNHVIKLVIGVIACFVLSRLFD